MRPFFLAATASRRHRNNQGGTVNRFSPLTGNERVIALRYAARGIATWPAAVAGVSDDHPGPV